MNVAYITFHQGYTDIILCIGLIFYNLEKYDKIILVMSRKCSKMLEFIFRSEKKIIIHYYKWKMKRFLKYINQNYSYTNNDDKINYLTYGYHSFKSKKPVRIALGGYDYFYKHYGIDSSVSYKYFIINRNLNLEKEKYNEITNRIGEEYIIFNEDNNRNFLIDRKRVNNTFKIFNINGSSEIVFDMILLLEKSKEIHLISTFWSLIIYFLQKKYNLFLNIPIYFHNYVRKGYYFHLYENSNWIILN